MLTSGISRQFSKPSPDASAPRINTPGAGLCAFSCFFSFHPPAPCAVRLLPSGRSRNLGVKPLLITRLVSGRAGFEHTLVFACPTYLPLHHDEEPTTAFQMADERVPVPFLSRDLALKDPHSLKLMSQMEHATQMWSRVNELCKRRSKQRRELRIQITYQLISFTCQLKLSAWYVQTPTVGL